MGGYWKTVLSEAWLAYVARIRKGLWEMILFTIQTAVLLGVLYFAPWLGDVQGEARMIAAGVGAVLMSALFHLAWELIRAPASLHNRVMVRLEDACKALDLRRDAEAVKNEMLNHCRQGRALLQAGNISRDAVETWKTQALSSLHANYDITHAYEFEHETGHWRDPESERERLKHLVGKLESIALSWGSRAERAYADFSALIPQHIPKPTEVVR